MNSLIVLVFAGVYLGMAAGRVPGLLIDRTGVALLGLIVLLASGALTLAQAGAATDIPTLSLLFALMILSAQFEGSGFYVWIASRIAALAESPHALLAGVIAISGLLSALLTNDVVAFALAPLLAAGLSRRGLDARPYLIGLAAACNAGSALTLIGNPQNILIGQAGHLDFWRYAAIAAPPVLASLIAIHLTLALTWAKALAKTPNVPEMAPAANAPARWPVIKGFLALAALLGLFFTPIPREIGALAIAGVLLLSRRMASRDMLGAVDWHLLILFIALFGVTAAFEKTGLAAAGLAALGAQGLDFAQLSVMAPITLIASNTIGNVPAVVLVTALLPDLGTQGYEALALISTLAGNLLLTGSMCNIIVAERAAAGGTRLSFLDFARSGPLMTAISLGAALIWLN